jgi:hypothetical protein
METRSEPTNVEKPPLAKPDVKSAKPQDPPRPMATIEDDDERLLARIGYRQVR